MAGNMWLLALCLPALLQGLEITVGEYELAPRTDQVPRTRIVSRMMENGDYEEVEETVSGSLNIEGREDQGDDPGMKWTTVFNEWRTASHLLRQCTIVENTVQANLYYYNGYTNFTAVRFTPKKDANHTGDFREIDGRDDIVTCLELAANGGYAVAQHFRWYGWIWTTGFACRASKIHYNLTEGEKCERDKTDAVFLINTGTGNSTS